MAVRRALLAVCVLCAAHVWPSRGFDYSFEVSYADQSYNDITDPNQEEDAPTTTVTPCESAELTKWDKLFSMLENSQMRENMLLESTDDGLRAELRSLRAELLRRADGLAAACGGRGDGAGRRLAAHLDHWLERALEQLREAGDAQLARLDAALQQLQLLGSRSAKAEGGCQNGPGGKAIQNDRKLQDVTAGDTGQLHKMLAAMATDLHKVQSQLDLSLWSRAPSSHPSGCETTLLFPMRSRRIFASVTPEGPVSLRSFTVCLWAKATESLNKTVLFSYGTRRNPHEIQLVLSGSSALFTVAGEAHLVEARGAVEPLRWGHYCGAWSSEQGLASLWVDGRLAAGAPGVAEGHALPEGGAMQLGQERNGCCAAPGFADGFDAKLAFAGRMTGVNMWDRVLGADEISRQARPESACSSRGNVVGWGVSEIVPHGGAQFYG
ncbi:pentraxin-related protein PTX3 [Scleropages formosus]|uniref:Pentraxin 3 n=1 Tax=Scleropages formosus TaxID=113540 RepID=A0A8D0C6N7_SCLFO|nr:pentraxin-related protein PTX3 [Scleropages formosus]